MKGHPKKGHPSQYLLSGDALFVYLIHNTEGAFVSSVLSKESSNRLEAVCYKRQILHQAKHARKQTVSKQCHSHSSCYSNVIYKSSIASCMSLTVTSAEAQSKHLPVDADPTSTQVVDDFKPTYELPSQEVSEIDFLQI